MAALTGNSIDSSYQGLIKTTDNGAITGTAKAVTDGLGNATNIEISNTATNFVSGTVDFTGSTVSGLPGGAAGLENGTGTDSLQSAAALTTNPADASGNGSIAIGDGASATRQESVAIGQGAEANGSGSEGSIAIGHGAIASANRGIAIGINGTTNSAEGIAIGDNVDIGGGADRVIALGNSINVSSTTADDSVVIGTQGASDGSRGIAIGRDAKVVGNGGIAIGDTAGYLTGVQLDAISIGKFSGFGSAVDTVQIGDSATAKAAQGVCIGKNARIESSNSTKAICIGEATGGVTTSDYGSGFIALGNGAKIDGAAGTVDVGGAIVIGKDARASALDAVALGKDVIAATASTVSLKALEVQTDSTPTAGGIIISDAGSTDRRINITSAGIPQIDSDPMLVNDSTTNTAMTKVWSGTEAQYNALGVKDSNTLYFLT